MHLNPFYKENYDEKLQERVEELTCSVELKFFVHKGEGLYTSHSIYHFWSIVYSCIFGHIIFPYIYIPYIYISH